MFFMLDNHDANAHKTMRNINRHKLLFWPKMKLTPIPKAAQQAIEPPPESITTATESRTNQQICYQLTGETPGHTGFS